MSAVEVQPTTATEKIGTCPACKTGVWADIDLIAHVEEPRMTDDKAGNRKPYVFASAEVVAARVSHECSSVEEDR